MTLKRVLPWVTLLLLCAVAVTPLLRTGKTPCTHDGGLHYFRVAAMKHAWQQGILFTRWLPDLAFGYGFPFFNYRAPTSYYLPLGLHLVGLPLPLVLNLVYVLSIVGSAAGAYLLARDLFGPQAGFVAAAAYAYAPYQLLNALVRGNAPESLALALMPFTLWAFRRLALEGRRRWFLASTGLLATLYLTHNISSLLFTPLLMAHLAMLWWVYRKSGHWRPVILALALALGMTAFFWLPALAEKRYVQLSLTTANRNNNFRYNFLSLAEVFAPPKPFDTSLMNPPPRIRLGLVQTVLAISGLVAIGLQACKSASEQVGKSASEQVCKWASLRERWVASGFFALTAGLMLFMSTRASLWVWEHTPLLPFVQFPWRFVGRAALPIALLVGAFAHYALRFTWSVLRIVYCVIIAAIVLAAFPATYPPTGYCPAKHYPTITDVHCYERNSTMVGVDPVGAYFPRWVQKRPRESPLEEQYANGGPVARFDSSVLPEGARVLEADYGPNRARLVVESPRAFKARYLTFHFPGWQVIVDGERVPITPSDPEGLITFNVPAGRHALTVRFGETPLRLGTDIFSALCLLAALLYTLQLSQAREDMQ